MNAAASIREPSLVTEGFAVRDGASVRRALAGPEGTIEEAPALQRSFARLPPDLYLPPGRQLRFRAFSELTFEAATGRIAPLARKPFEQSAAVNPLYGGVARRFEPLEPAALDSRLVGELIAYDHMILSSLPGGRGPVTWRVGLHQIRVVGTETLAGEPTPEGIHRDGHRFVAVHLLGRRNVSGGAFRIHDDQHRTLFVHTAVDLLDTVFLDDPRVKHSVTPIRPLDPSAGLAERDVLLVTWDAP